MLADVLSFQVGADLVAATERPMRESGAQGYERFVLWCGAAIGSTFVVRSVYVPAQTSYRLESGLCVRVDGEELFRLNQWLFEHKETLGIQLHSHPFEAYHSETDNAFPIATEIGALSIVVPNFCRGGLWDPGTVTYRLRSGGWREVPAAAARRLVKVVS